MNVLISGAHGLVGSALVSEMNGSGHRVATLERAGSSTQAFSNKARSIRWNPEAGEMDREQLADGGPFDAVVHLAGAGIGDSRWSPARKKVIADSRILSTRLLAEAIALLDPMPNVMVCASAIGIYGNRSDEALTEESHLGTGFLADLCKGWEQAADPAREAGIRVVELRSGIVLAAHGGALARQLTLFRTGLGGRLGDGRQYVSWISLDDEIAVILHAIDDPTLGGPVNATSPHPVTNAAFTKALGHALHRPALFVVPRPAIRLAFGSQMADEMILASQRVLPAKLLEHDHQFLHPDLETAFEAVLS
jgi:uncharacterized protein